MKNQAKKSLRIAIALLVSFIMMSGFFAPAFAWYLDSLSTTVKVESQILGSYFEQGNGTADTPYVIARPIQLYYFAWLQNLGYFDGDNPSSTTSDKKFYFTLGADIDMSENIAYSVLPPIGTLDHPFVGVFNGQYHYAPTDEQGNAVTDPFDPNNTKEGTYHVIKNLTISNDDLSNVPTHGEEQQQYVGLFGVIGSMSNSAVTGTVKNFGLYNLTVETKDPEDNKTIIGIVAGYCNGTFEGVGVSDCKIKIKNGVDPTNVTTYQVDPETGTTTSTTVTPRTLSFSLIGFSDQTYQAYNISPVSGGNEFGGSLAMETIYNKIIAAKSNANTERYSYYRVKTVNIDENGVRTESFSDEMAVDLHADGIGEFFYLEEYEEVDANGNAYESYAAVERYSSAAKLVIADGNGHFLAVNSSGSIYNTDDETEATIWTTYSSATSNSENSLGTNTSGSRYLAVTIGNTKYLLRQNNGTLATTTSTSNATNWSFSVGGTTYDDFSIYSGSYYITYNNGWTLANSSRTIKAIRKPSGTETVQYTYLNGGYTVQKTQKVITITHTAYDAYLIQDESGNYLVGTTAGNISNTTNSENATAWRFSNGASGGTFSIQSDDEVTYYLRNNNGTLEVSTTSTNWTISNGKISNGGYYLVYLDGAWKLWQETTYYSIDNGSGTYLNFANSNLTGGASSTTRWHIADNKIYTYNGTTKTYLYNNNGTLTTTTTVGTASTWTVDNANHTIKNGDYYLIYIDGAWKVLAETTYYSIDDGAGNYLNYSGSVITDGSNSTTRWHIADNKIYTYNGTTKTYLYNNNGTLATTTTVGTATAWTINNTNHTISNNGYYLVYLDGAWKLFAETTYYSIDNGSGTYLNFANSNLTGGASSTTRWHIADNKIYTYNGTTKTYLYNNNGTLTTTTTVGTASTWTVDNANHTIKNGDYYLIYLDGAWKVLAETTYYSIDDGAGNYLNYSGSAITDGSNSTTRWHIANNKIYTYNGTTKTYIYNNNGTLATTTTAGTATAWTINNTNHTISNNGYYLVYLDGAWKLWQETVYYSINDGNNHYLNLTNGNIVAGASSITKWHFSNGASGGVLYTYINGTKTYLYRNGRALATTTNSGTASTWTVDGSNHFVTTDGYYLCYNDSAWGLTQETEYYAINNGSGTYLNLSNGNIVGGSNSTRWFVSGGKIYTYVNDTATYLVNNAGTLTTTTTAGSASVWTISNGRITNGGYYLCYNDSAWGLKEESEYYLINNGSSTYLNLSNGDVASGTSSNATRWYVSSNKIYAYNGTTKTYLYNNSGVLATTTNSSTASTWTIANNSIINNGYYLCYNDSAWGLKEEAGYYLINNGSSTYLNLSNGDIASGTSSNATRWYVSSNKIYAYNGTTKTYLYNNSGALATTTTVGTASTWIIANNNIKNGDYYLIYDGEWILRKETSYYLISDGSGNYFNLSNGSFVVGTSSNATKWHNASGKIYTYINNTATYLVNNSGVLTTTTTVGSATTWTVGADSITNGGYYLVYQNGWLLTNETAYYLISDGSGHYFNLTSNGFEVGTSSNAVGWHFSNGASGGRIYTYVNGTATYLVNNAGTLSTTTTVGSASTWTVSNGQISNGGYYIVYSNGWIISNVSTYYTLSDNYGHYLNLTSSGFAVGTSSNATKWQITNTSSGKIYTYINDTATYIYNNNGTLASTTNSSTASTWTINNSAKTIINNNYYLRYNGTNWVLTNSLTDYYISDNAGHYLNLNTTTHLTEIGTASNATIWTFTSAGNNTYYISTDANGTQYYLNFSVGDMVPGTSQTTAWTVDTTNNRITCKDSGNTDYYMFCDGYCWTIIRSGISSYYLISDGNGNYLSCTTTISGNNATNTIANQTVRSYAKKWVYDSNDYLSFTLRTGNRNRTFYLYTDRSTLSVGTSSRTWTISGNQMYYSYRSGSFWSGYTYTYYHPNYSGGSWSLGSKSSTDSVPELLESVNCSQTTAVREMIKMIGYTENTYSFTNSISSSNYDLSIGISNGNYNLTANAPYTSYSLTTNTSSTSYSLTANTSSTNYNIVANTTSSSYDVSANLSNESYYNIVASTSSSNYSLVANFVSANYDLTNETESATAVWKNTVTTTETIDAVSKDTYIALATNDDGSTSLKNTGYIVGGSNYYDASSYSGDIRVSYYTMSNLSASLNSSTTYNDSRLEVLTQTYLSNGLKRIYDSHNASNNSVSSNISSYTKDLNTTSVSALGLEKYDEARDQLQETLTGQSNIYGLHFMDAQININNLARIGKAVINGSTYMNYSVPQDCIDFNLSTKGSINFFAGTYFPSNDSFFSLHRILRTDGEIVAIREISKIYGVPNDTSKNYIYWYADEASQPTLPTGYILMFDTAWIKTPTMVNNAMYYYEIPVNAGEYALGSVNGGLGAYLIYLDIGASAQSLSDGTTLETSIKGIDFVTYSSLSANSIAATLQGIQQNTPSSAVIILKTRFQGEIDFSIQEVTVDNAQVLRIGYVLSDTSAKDYVLWTKSNSSVEVVDNTVYT